MDTGLEGGAEEVLFSGWILNQLIVLSSSSVGGRMDTGLEGGAEEVLFSGWILNQLIVWSSSSVGGRVIQRCTWCQSCETRSPPTAGVETLECAILCDR